VLASSDVHGLPALLHVLELVKYHLVGKMIQGQKATRQQSVFGQQAVI
jgi:hypothetical protein